MKLEAKLEAKLGVKLGAKPGAKLEAQPGAKLEAKLGAKLGAKYGVKLGAKLSGVLDMYSCSKFCARAWLEFMHLKTLKYDAILGANGLSCCSGWIPHGLKIYT